MNERTNGLGKLLEQARLRKGLTQKQVAEALGVQQTYVSAIETGARKWPADYIRPLSRLLGLSQVEMAVAAGLIDAPSDAPPAPVVDFRLKEIVENWPRFRESVQITVHRMIRDMLDDPLLRDADHEEPVIAVAR